MTEEASSTTTPPDIIASKKGPGVLLRTLRPGDGIQFPKQGDLCLVHFEGRLEQDGTKLFASSDNHKFQFELGAKQVLEGWEVAIAKMSVGQVAEVTIPSLYAYGALGCPPKIPPRATLIFILELLQINNNNDNDEDNSSSQQQQQQQQGE